LNIVNKEGRRLTGTTTSHSLEYSGTVCPTPRRYNQVKLEKYLFNNSPPPDPVNIFVEGRTGTECVPDSFDNDLYARIVPPRLAHYNKKSTIPHMGRAGKVKSENKLNSLFHFNFL
jgi:hypothetical protein